jgi:hypothetical protein
MTSKKSSIDLIQEKHAREREIRDHASAVADQFLLDLNVTSPEEDVRALQLLCGVVITKIIAKGDKYRATDFLHGVLGIALSPEFPEPTQKPHPMNLM